MGVRHRLTAVTAALRAAQERRGQHVPPLLGDVLVTLAADHPPGPERADDDRIGHLAPRFELTGVDEDLLAVAAAGELDPNVALAYGLLAGTEAPAWPTVGLALELVDASPLDPAARSRLNPLSPLVLQGLLEVRGDGPALSRRLAVPDRVAAHLVGDDAPDPLLLECLDDVPTVRTDASDAVAKGLLAGVRLTWVRSPQGSAGVSVAAGGVVDGGETPLVVDLGRIADPVLLGPVVSAAVREASLLDRPLVLAGAERLVAPDGVSLVNRLLPSAVPVVCVADRGWDPGWAGRIPLLVDAPALDLPTRAAAWATALADTGLDLDPGTDAWRDVLAMRLTPPQIWRAARDAGLTATVEGRQVQLDDVRRAVRRLAATGAATPPRTTATFDDLVLPRPTLDELRRIVSWARHRDAVLAQGPLTGAGGKGTGIAALFGGGPGTGKTLAAHVIADALGLDLFRVDLSTVVDKYVGETEKNLERVFAEAESMNVVLFFDEADSIFGARSAVSDARDRYANLEVSYLLQRMEDFDGITILATNLRGNLDPAFSRRLQFLVTFPDPDADTRHRLWHQHLRHVAVLDDGDPPDVDLLAEHAELAGGDIRNIVLASAYAAAEDNDGRVGMRHLAAATHREYTKLRKRAPAQLDPWARQSSEPPAQPAARG